MPRRSAGILLYRRHQGALEVLLVHPGGPMWANRDAGAWSIPKGEYATARCPSTVPGARSKRSPVRPSRPPSS